MPPSVYDIKICMSLANFVLLIYSVFFDDLSNEYEIYRKVIQPLVPKVSNSGSPPTL